MLGSAVLPPKPSLSHSSLSPGVKSPIRAFTASAATTSPDITSSDPDAQDFIDIHNAYATLSDPAARASYDLSIRASPPCYRFKYSTSNTFQGHRPPRRWETDQCW
ncbi:hypothetical protein OIU79_013469 [Salix purpurea]|uniref:J domain-containing protein n=1 Tax=Salix purpurea TaxID=77065 RepID=A0A9Q0Q5R4_SALPP|nr:hypothetical protein OIU79_013469 [Salix purpurea]